MTDKTDTTTLKGKYGIRFDDGTERRFRTSLEFKKWLHNWVDRNPEEECGWAYAALNNLDLGIKFTEAH